MNVCVSSHRGELFGVNTDAKRGVCLLYKIFVSLCIVGLRPMAPVPCVWQAGLYFSLQLHEYAWPPGLFDKALWTRIVKSALKSFARH